MGTAVGLAAAVVGRVFAVVVLLVPLVLEDVSTAAEEGDDGLEDGADSSVRLLSTVSSDTVGSPSVATVLVAELDSALENDPTVILVVCPEGTGVSAGLQEASTQAATISAAACRIYLHMPSPFPAPAVI